MSDGPGEPRLLVVDDEPGVRAALSVLADRVGLSMVGVASGEEALAALEHQRFACGVVDLRMPGMSGYSLIRRCRSAFPQLPIVAMSGQGDKQDIIECLRLGVVDYVSKPWTESEIRSAIVRALARSALPASSLAACEPRPLPKGSHAFAEPVLRAIREGSLALPGFPDLAHEARLLAASSKASAARMRELVERDPRLAGRLLLLANNPYFQGYGRVTELQSAIVRVGYREVPTLLDTLIAHELYAVDCPDAERREAIPQIWEHAWARAIVMRFLAQERPELGPTPEQAYLAGLFSNVGLPFLIKALSQAAPGASYQDVLAAAAEHHAEVGELLAQAWGLPEECRMLARRHHDPVPLEKTDGLVLLAWASEAICLQLGIAGEPLTIPFPEEAMRLLNLGSAGRTLLAGKAGTYLKQVGQSLEATQE